MTPPRLDKALLRDTLRLVAEHGGISQASRAAGVPYATFTSRVKSARLLEAEEPFPIETAEDRQAIPRGLPFEREWATFLSEIGCAKDRYAGPAKPKARVGRLRILVVPDLHAPFYDRKAVAAMLERERDIDICVLMGDIGDSYSLSRFIKYQDVPYEEELASVTLLLQTFSERFPIVRIIQGNHDGPRLEKQLLERLSKDMVTAIRFMTGGVLDPIEALCKRFPNIEYVTPKTNEGHPMKWLTQIGDAVFAHAEIYSRVPTNAVRRLDDWLTDYEQVANLEDFRVVVQAHTHQLSWNPWKADRLLVECGALCQTAGYMISPKLGGRPQRIGWVVLEQVDGKTDINSLRPVWYGAELK